MYVRIVLNIIDNKYGLYLKSQYWTLKEKALLIFSYILAYNSLLKFIKSMSKASTSRALV